MDELRRRSAIVFLWLQAGWSALSAAEREEVRRLLVKSGGRPTRLSKSEARTARRAGRPRGERRRGGAPPHPLSAVRHRPGTARYQAGKVTA